MMTHHTKHFARALALAVLIATCGPSACWTYSEGAADPTQGVIDWSGAWRTNFGPIQLAVVPGEPNRVRGSYAYNLQGRVVRGALEGEMSGAELAVAWQDEPGGVGAGRARFVMDADRRSFEGTWGHGQSETGGGEWNGLRD